MGQSFNKKKKPKHISKIKYTFDEEENKHLLFNGIFCKAQSVSYASKFKLYTTKLTKKWTLEKQEV